MVDDTDHPDQRIVLVRHAQTEWSLTGQDTGTTDLVFGHGHGLTALTIRCMGLPIDRGRHPRLGTGSVSAREWKREVRVPEVWTDRKHLPEAP